MKMNYEAHSFHFGAASAAYEWDFQRNQLWRTGRWKSNVLLNLYLVSICRNKEKNSIPIYHKFNKMFCKMFIWFQTLPRTHWRYSQILYVFIKRAEAKFVLKHMDVTWNTLTWLYTLHKWIGFQNFSFLIG